MDTALFVLMRYGVQGFPPCVGALPHPSVPHIDKNRCRRKVIKKISAKEVTVVGVVPPLREGTTLTTQVIDC